MPRKDSQQGEPRDRLSARSIAPRCAGCRYRTNLISARPDHVSVTSLRSRTHCKLLAMKLYSSCSSSHGSGMRDMRPSSCVFIAASLTVAFYNGSS
ncbi:hypothetical protein Bxe_A3889 [Paraburkholderia xenovorans LB400]|uniref:Uncharacterized protein n=1 Tax=Paraburkholderia xenovorans (strain LB400) TaxID=266265 RepID=Q144Y1_PARXL|nr:hypothetical protein Bxe_A3889 [Paraburkholderia xenovorans LB400]